MTQYIYPQNLRAKANLWLWNLRDFLIMGIAALLSVVILVQTYLVSKEIKDFVKSKTVNNT